MTPEELNRLRRFADSAEASVRRAAERFRPQSWKDGRTYGPAATGPSANAKPHFDGDAGGRRAEVAAALTALGLNQKAAAQLARECNGDTVVEMIRDALQRRTR